MYLPNIRTYASLCSSPLSAVQPSIPSLPSLSVPTVGSTVLITCKMAIWNGATPLKKADQSTGDKMTNFNPINWEPLLLWKMKMCSQERGKDTETIDLKRSCVVCLHTKTTSLWRVNPVIIVIQLLLFSVKSTGRTKTTTNRLGF